MKPPGVKRFAAFLQSQREALKSQGAAEERQRIESEAARASEEKLQAGLVECTRERDSAYETLTKDQAEYDKQLLTLSAGLLALSLAFIKDVVPLKDAVYLWELYVTWYLLIGCIISVLVSFRYSISAHFKLAKFWELTYIARAAEAQDRDEIQRNIDRLGPQLQRYSKLGNLLNVASGALFVAGIVLLVAFAVSNVRRQANAMPPLVKPTLASPSAKSVSGPVTPL